ncbi:hypothetical protein [Erythrobacter aureus]|uniref:Uncharacterized protein n=1 Tax=Erythrobacter aureus TaxID=2182384 RepID=A0A345YIP5_9SPHN|nr:hypothetical protein [Erythrobacter aureus]AXK43797.1 hypothetical protein DVR09_15180 [Erythrobacter aureus]
MNKIALVAAASAAALTIAAEDTGPYRADKFPLLAAAGFTFSKDGALAPGGDEPIRRTATLDKLEGRLANVRYMAAAMDEFDIGSTDQPTDVNGRRQFEHLMSESFPDRWTGYIYVAMRRFQRDGEFTKLALMLGMLIAYEDKLISGRALLESIALDLVQMADLRDDDGEKGREA